jgi:hypothetical protein
MQSSTTCQKTPLPVQLAATPLLPLPPVATATGSQVQQ